MKRLSWALVVTVSGMLALGYPVPRAQQPPVQNDAVLGGVLTAVWGDPLVTDRQADIPRLLVYLTDAAGTRTLLSVSELVLQAAGGLRALNGRQVVVTVGQRAVSPLGQEPSTEVRAIRLARAEEMTSAVVDHSSQPLSGAQPRAVILCRFSDSPGTTPHPPSYFTGLMGATFPGLNHYWGEVSYANINLDGTQVFGWYNLPMPLSYYLYDRDGDGTPELDLGRSATDCTAAADADVYYPNFTAIDLNFNHPLWCCAYGGLTQRNLDGVIRVYGMTWMPSWAQNSESYAHESGHSLGFPHSSGPYNETYDSIWDPMSYWRGTCLRRHPTYGCTPVHTIMYHKDLDQWIPASRRFDAPPNSNTTITIERSAQPDSSGYLFAKIPIGGSTTNYYTVEARRFVGYDNELPGEAIIIHKVDTTRIDRDAQVVDPDNNGDPNDAGAMWMPGESFIDSVNQIAVLVNAQSASGYSVTISRGLLLPTLRVDDRVLSEGNSGTAMATFTVTLSAAASDTITVDYATADGTATTPSDYLAQSGTLIFSPGETSETVSVPIVGDTLPEPNETFFVNLSNAINAAFGDAQGQATITNDDAGGLSIDDVSVVEGHGGTTNAVFTVSLTPAHPFDVSVDFATANGTATASVDYVASSGTLTFAAGQTSRTVVVPVSGDTVSEPTERFLVNLSNAISTVMSDGTGIGMIVTDDVAGEDLAIDFGAAGLWGFYNGSAYAQRHTATTEEMVTGDLDGNNKTDLIVDFPGHGIWVYENNAAWTQLHTVNAATLATGDLDGNGKAEVLIDFPGYGLWVRYDSGEWFQLHPQSPGRLVTGDLDGNGKADAIIDFPGHGVWVWSNNATWFQLHPFNAVALAIGDFDASGKDDLIVDFRGFGLWVWSNNTSWFLLHQAEATVMTPGDLDGNGRADLIISFPGVGIWAWMNATDFVQLHTSNGGLLTAADIDGNGKSDLIVSFPGFGLWAWMNHAIWRQLHIQNPENVATGHFDGL